MGALKDAKKLMDEGALIFDGLAGHGTITAFLDAEYLYERQSLFQRIMNKPRTWQRIQLEYMCTGSGDEPFPSVGYIGKGD